jgi:phage-related protein
MTMLRENGPGWRSNAIEKLGEGVYEMRSGRSRLYFAVLSGTRIVVLDAHIKKSKKEQSKIIQRAIELLRDLKSMEVIGDVSGIN